MTNTWEFDKNCGPGLFGDVAREHPKAKIILAHAGGTQEGCQQAIRVVKEHDNLYLDTATSQLHIGMIERFVSEVGADRLLFGSDVPLLEPAAQLGPIAYARIKGKKGEDPRREYQQAAGRPSQLTRSFTGRAVPPQRGLPAPLAFAVAFGTFPRDDREGDEQGP